MKSGLRLQKCWFGACFVSGLAACLPFFLGRGCHCFLSVGLFLILSFAGEKHFSFCAFLCRGRRGGVGYYVIPVLVKVVVGRAVYLLDARALFK